MYTDIDVLLIVIFTVMITVIVTMILFSCVLMNGTEKEKEVAYWRGFSDGKKSR